MRSSFEQDLALAFEHQCLVLLQAPVLEAHDARVLSIGVSYFEHLAVRRQAVTEKDRRGEPEPIETELGDRVLRGVLGGETDDDRPGDQAEHQPLSPGAVLHFVFVVVAVGAVHHQGNHQLGRNRQQQARQYYQELLENFPDSHYKTEAQFNIAESLYREKSYLEARFEYQKFLELHPLHPLASRAQFQIGMCSLQQIQRYDRSQRHTQEGLQAFRLLRRKYPQDPLVPQAEAHIHVLRAHLAKRELSVARFYYKKRAYHAAIGRLLNLIQLYPTTSDLDEALYMLADSYRAEENYVKTQRVLRLLVDRFPTSKYVSRARAQLRQLPNTGITLQ